jgi:hypothetical protein
MSKFHLALMDQDLPTNMTNITKHCSVLRHKKCTHPQSSQMISLMKATTSPPGNGNSKEDSDDSEVNSGSSSKCQKTTGRLKGGPPKKKACASCASYNCRVVAPSPVVDSSTSRECNSDEI